MTDHRLVPLWRNGRNRYPRGCNPRHASASLASASMKNILKEAFERNLSDMLQEEDLNDIGILRDYIDDLMKPYFYRSGC